MKLKGKAKKLSKKGNDATESEELDEIEEIAVLQQRYREESPASGSQLARYSKYAYA
jgi:hypothetical protein